MDLGRHRYCREERPVAAPPTPDRALASGLEAVVVQVLAGLEPRQLLAQFLHATEARIFPFAVVTWRSI